MKLTRILKENSWIHDLSLDEVREILVEDAMELSEGAREYIGTIELVPSFEQKLTPQHIQAYLKELINLESQFDDIEEEEEDFVDARYELTMNFLIEARLATQK